MYENGYEFFKSLESEYGHVLAVEMAKDYLDMQIRNTDPEEYQFCKELYQAMKEN